jgi:hypothetical protein
MDVITQNTEVGYLTAEIQRLRLELERLKAPRQFHYGDALGFLRAVYNNESLPLGVRLDAARTAIKYETPALSAVAVNCEEHSIADRLAEARKRYEQQQREARALSPQDQKLKMIS